MTESNRPSSLPASLRVLGLLIAAGVALLLWQLASSETEGLAGASPKSGPVRAERETTVTSARALPRLVPSSPRRDATESTTGDPPVAPARPPQIPSRGMAERTGPFAALRDALERDGIDATATTDEYLWMQEMLAEHSVEPNAVNLRCSRALCRADFLFDDHVAARELSRVRLPSDFSVMAAPLDVTPDESARLVVFWGRNGKDLQSFLPRVEDAR